MLYKIVRNLTDLVLVVRHSEVGVHGVYFDDSGGMSKEDILGSPDSDPVWPLVAIERVNYVRRLRSTGCEAAAERPNESDGKASSGDVPV